MYLSWSEQTITDFSEENINALYNRGFVFTRPAKGLMKQTRSLRIDLSKFELSSENRRILKKTEDLRLKIEDLPYKDYTWQIGKMAKDFYDTKFGVGTFSANKIKELMTDQSKSNFNKLLVYEFLPFNPIAYSICQETNELLHYSYPFYNLQSSILNLGMSMMLRAILYAQENKKKYIYLGSAQRPTDVYKLQFKGLDWFDGKKWITDLEELKNILHAK